MRLATAIVFLCLIALPAQSHQFNCDEVRAYVAAFGKAQALAAAIRHGATWREIMDAKRCLNSKQ